MVNDLRTIVETADRLQLVRVFADLFAGEKFETENRRFAEFVAKIIDSSNNDLAQFNFESAISDFLSSLRVRSFLRRMDEDIDTYGLSELFALMEFLDSRLIGRSLIKLRTNAERAGVVDRFDQHFSRRVCRVLSPLCYDPDIAQYLLQLARQKAYATSISHIYFSLLDWSPSLSIELAPAFVRHYRFAMDGVTLKMIEKRLHYYFRDRDISAYTKSLSEDVAEEFWRILLRTPLSDRVVTIMDFEYNQQEFDMPSHSLFLTRDGSGEIEKSPLAEQEMVILGAQMSEARNNPDLVRSRIAHLIKSISGEN